MSGDVSDEFLIFLRRPKPSLNLLLVAARMMTHLSSYVAVCLLLFLSFSLVPSVACIAWIRLMRGLVCNSEVSLSSLLKKQGEAEGGADIYDPDGVHARDPYLHLTIK